MALNVVGNIDNVKFNNEQYTTYKKMSKLPIISIQSNKNFSLIQNKKGNIIRKPVFSGYTKNKLSSIPRDVEIILLDKDKNDILGKIKENVNTSKSKDYLFSNNIYINPHSNNNTKNLTKEMTRCLSSQISSNLSENINNKTIVQLSTNTSKSITNINNKKNDNSKEDKKESNYWKFYKKGKNNSLSDYQNKLSFEEFKSQFYPGPSDYYCEKSYDLINSQNKYRYNSLYKSEIHKSKKNKNNNSPGPGSYFKMNNIIKNDKHISINLGRKEKRFENLFRNHSPWYYSTNSVNNNIKSKNLENLNNKDFYEYHHYIIKEEISDTGDKRQYFIEDLNHKINDNKNNETKVKIKFFDNKKNEVKRNFNNLLKKYINTNDIKSYEIPGPGQYNIYVGFDKILKDNAIDALKYSNKPEKFIPENILKEYSLSKRDPSIKSSEPYTNEKYLKKGIGYNSCENIFKQETTKSGGGTLPFISKKKRIEYHDDLLMKHTPGPCYYYNDSSSQTKETRKIKNIFKI